MVIPNLLFPQCRRFSGSLPLTLHLHHQCLSLFAFWSQFNEMCSKIKHFHPLYQQLTKKKSGVNFVVHVQQHLGRQEKLKQCLQRRRCCMGKCKAMTMHTFTSRRSWRSPRPALTKWLLAPDRGGRKTHNHIKDYMTTLQQLCSTGISLAHTDLHLLTSDSAGNCRILEMDTK